MAALDCPFRFLDHQLLPFDFHAQFRDMQLRQQVSCHYRVADLQNSRLSLQHAVDLDNDNAKAFVFLGNVAGREDHDDEAENHFKTAIQIDPTLSDPYYNLAVIYLRKGMKEEALQFYQEALKRGADPNLEFEASLALG